MVLCPNCGKSLSGLEHSICSAACGWQSETRSGTHILLSQADKEDPILAEYFQNYDVISEDDLVQPILDERYVENQVTNLVGYMGNVEGLEICDLGCGQGRLSRALLERGAAHITAVDIALGYLRRLESLPGITPILANAENLPFAEAFDIVVATDVMEHVLNVGSFLFALNRALKISGRAYIRVPYRESLLAYSPQMGCSYRFVHLRSFNADILGLYMRAAGFVVERFHLDGFSVQTPQEFWLRGSLRQCLYNRLQQMILRRLDHPADVTLWNPRMASLFMRPQEIVVVARKSFNLEKPPNSGNLPA